MSRDNRYCLASSVEHVTPRIFLFWLEREIVLKSWDILSSLQARHFESSTVQTELNTITKSNSGLFSGSYMVCNTYLSSHNLDLRGVWKFKHVRTFVASIYPYRHLNRSRWPWNDRNRPLSHGDHFESQENKKLCVSTSSLALDESLDVQNLLFQHCVIKVYGELYYILSV